MKYHALALSLALLAASPAHAQQAPVSDEEADFEQMNDDLYRFSTRAFALSNSAVIYLNLRREEPRGVRLLFGGLGVASGGLQAVAGSGGLSDADTRPYGIFNLAFGATTVALGIRTLLRPDAPARPLAAAPLATHEGIGLAATLRF